MDGLVQICPMCHSKRLKKYDIYRYEGQNKTRYKCANCGHITISPLLKSVTQRRRRSR